MKLPEDASQINATFAYRIDQYDDSITIWKDGKEIVLSYWESFILLAVLQRNITT